MTITKVNPYHLQNEAPMATDDRMLEFEQLRYTRGAIESSEYWDKQGNYYTIFWKTESKSPVTVRFEYRQGKTGSEVHMEETLVAEPKRSNVTKFQVTGDTYHDLGKVTQWKASIVENGTVVAEYKSYLWQ
ncbi:MAG TPA: hypothetical protein PK529_14695 [Verrucomicrobiales bacterium]|nr:hypothetical protein [Verrucomicrobiales bacterium]